MITSVKCEDCKKEFLGSSFKELKREGIIRIGKRWKCFSCKCLQNKKHRDYLLHDVLGVRRRMDMEREWKEKRRLKEQKKQSLVPSLEERIEDERNNGKNYVPIIPGAKQPKKIFTTGSRNIHVYITKVERVVLWKKYKNIVPEQELNKQLNHLSECMGILATKLRKKNKNISDDDLENRLREEYAKLVMEMEENLQK